MIVISGHARVKAASRSDALAAASEMGEASRAEDGCVEYRFAVDIDDPDVVRLFECWESVEHLEAHFATPHFALFSGALAEALDDEAEFVRYEVESAGPLF